MENKRIELDFHPELELLRSRTETLRTLPSFDKKLDESGLHPLTPTSLDILQVNVGYMCNMTCKHCHVDAGPHRTEIMPKETLQHCLDAYDAGGFKTVDITGGAPEMNPDFRWFVDELYKRGAYIIVRSNLTILVTTPRYRELPAFFAERGVEVTCSLPFYNKVTTDRQRGEGTYDRSVEALKILNELGYGIDGTELELNLVYNPAGAFLPLPQHELEADFKRQLRDKHGIQYAFRSVLEYGCDYVVIIGSDCLELTQYHINTALDNLHSNDAVIGPATDGGYYLLGLKTVHHSLFTGKKWSTDTVLEDTILDIRALDWSCSTLAPLSDIDTLVDLNAIRPEWLYNDNRNSA